MNAPRPWSPLKRRIVSILLLLHLIAIFAAPMAGPPPASDLSRTIAGWFRPYLKAAYLNHGYRFFAPNPGPSHLIRYEVTLADGSTASHRFPDTSEQWPRLFYHRHFMVAERVNQLMSLPEPEELEADEAGQRELAERLRFDGHPELAREVEDRLKQQRAAIAEQRRLRDGLLEGIAAYFLEHHGAKRIKIWSVRHPLPTPLDLRAGARLDDPASYLERPAIEWPRVVELPGPTSESAAPLRPLPGPLSTDGQLEEITP